MTSRANTRVDQRIDDWKLKLIDLTRRNKLINYKETKTSSLKITSPKIDTIFNRLAIDMKPWEIWTPTNPIKPRRRTQLSTSQTDPQQIDKILKNLIRRSLSEYRERGIRILYLTFGMLNWKDPISKETLRSPLILVPVEINRKTPRGPIKIQIPSIEDEVSLNPALKLKLHYEQQIELPPLPDFEEKKVSEYLEQIAQNLSTLECELEQSIDLGLFSFQKLVMYQDLHDNKKHISQHPIIRALAGEKYKPRHEMQLPKEDTLDQINPKETFQVLDADSSQQLCIQYALNEQSFVMHGPPGTGKSQTIGNLISEFIARGKSVLFVSEKMAALEVVHNRLKAKNLDEYCLELHSQKANKREVVKELNRCLTENLGKGRSLSDEELDRLLKRRIQLKNYVDSLHKTRENINLTAYQILGNLSKLDDIPYITTDYPYFKSLDQKKLSELEDIIHKLSNTWTVVEEGDNFPWIGCIETNFSPETRANWIHLLDTISSTLETLIQDSNTYSQTLKLTTPHTIHDYENLQTLSNIISQTPRPPREWFTNINLEEVQVQTEEHRKNWEWYRTQKKFLRTRYDSRFLVLPTGIADSIDRAYQNLLEWLQITANGERELYTKRQELRNYLDTLPRIIDQLADEATKITETLGVKQEINNLEWISKLSLLSDLCQEKTRPPRAWLERNTSQRVKQAIEELKDKQNQKQTMETRLQNYKESFLQLDHNQLIEYFEGPRRSPLRFLTPKYYKVNSLISQHSQTNNVPISIIEDLKTARDYTKLIHELSSRLEKHKKTLGPYIDQVLDIEVAEKALDTANQVIKIMGKSRIPKTLRDNLCYGTEPNPELIQTSKNLRTHLTNLRKKTNQLKKILPAKLINTKKSLRTSNLQKIIEWTRESSERQSRLENVGSQAYATILKPKITYNDIVNDLKTSERLQDFEDDIKRKSNQYTQIYGELYNGLQTNWDNVKNAIGWTIQLLRTLPSGVSEELVQAISQRGKPLPKDPKINDRWDQIAENLNILKKQFDPPFWPNPQENLNLDNLHSSIQNFRTRIDDLRLLVDFKNLVKQLTQEGLEELVNKLVNEKTDREKIVPIFQKTMYQGILELFYDQDETLKTFRGQDHEQIINDFQRLDQRLITYAPYRVIENINKSKPQGVFVQSPDSEITILMREAAKKRRHMPLRDLFEKIPNLIQLLKPCLMMSPISVSQFLIPGGIHFDLVVFDEASQIYTEDAIGSIYRGDQFIVAGDPKQLPPTPFFHYILSDDFDWDTDYDFDLFDSVLDECMSIGLPVQMLKWHYRSKHESLIGFSNENFYDDRLIIFPSSHMRDEELGVEFVYVPNAIYNRGTTRDNPIEAEAVTEIVFKQFENHPEKTVGVVTFSIAQMNKIQDSIEQKLRENPSFEKFFIEDRLNGFFVKNLENVQGDERDVMIFSVGYGFDKEGRMTMNFGPLNKPGGERRLNVAITRAKEKVILISSIHSDSINLENTKALGVQSLHHYLRYAEKRPKKPDIDEKINWDDLEIEQEVAQEIEKMGYKAVPRIGVGSFRVDLGVLDPINPDNFILGILFDGENYRTAKTTRDRDRLREQILTNNGWRTYKIWTPDWVQQRIIEVNRLETAITSSIKTQKKQTFNPVTPKNITVSKNLVQEKPSNELPQIQPYSLAKLRPRRLLNLSRIKNHEKYIKQYRSEVRRLIPQLVQTEAPINIEYAYKRLNKVLRVRGTTTQKKAYLDEVMKLNKKLRVQGDNLWRKDDEHIPIRAPAKDNSNTNRPIQYIPFEEIYEAMLLVAKHSMGLSKQSLIQETAHLLGFKSARNKIKQVLTQVFNKAIESGKLVEDDNLIKYNE